MKFQWESMSHRYQVRQIPIDLFAMIKENILAAFKSHSRYSSYEAGRWIKNPMRSESTVTAKPTHPAEHCGGQTKRPFLCGLTYRATRLENTARLSVLVSCYLKRAEKAH